MTIGRSVHDWCFRYDGSTRSAALLRIAMALLIWYRYHWGAGASLSATGIAWAIALHLSVLCMVVGFQSRLASLAAGAVVLGAYWYIGAVLHVKEWWHHHTYLLGAAAVLLALTPCGRSYSMDRLLAKRRATRDGAPLPTEEGNLFGMRLLAIQLVVLYFFAFWDKVFVANSNQIFYGFLNGSRLEQILLWHYYGSDFVIQPWMTKLSSAASVAVAVLELLLPLMLIERFQKWLVVPGMLLHVAFYVMLPLSTYSLTCIALYLAIIDANRIHSFIEMLRPERAVGESVAFSDASLPRSAS